MNPLLVFSCVIFVSCLGSTVAIAVGVTVGCVVLITVIVIVIIVLHRKGLLKKKGMEFGYAGCT